MEFNYHNVSRKDIELLEQNNKILNLNYISLENVNNAMLNDKYFSMFPNKKQVVDDMLKYIMTRENSDKTIYTKKTNYICDMDEKICICNTHANDFRKIYDGNHYTDEICVTKLSRRLTLIPK